MPRELDEHTRQSLKSDINSLMSEDDEITKIANLIHWNPLDEDVVGLKHMSDQLSNHLKTIEKYVLCNSIEQCQSEIKVCKGGIRRFIDKCKLGEWDNDEFQMLKHSLDNAQNILDKCVKTTLIENYHNFDNILSSMQTNIENENKNEKI